MWLSAGRPSLPESRAAHIIHIAARCSIEGGWRWWKQRCAGARMAHQTTIDSCIVTRTQHDSSAGSPFPC
eukprot:3617041-Prymnesium_polylepis.1